ncbi:hypothetical protein ACS0TY_001697 [Phlomoides rotata]
MTKDGDGSKIGTTIDVSSPYFISSSDNPSHVFVTDLLSDGNYGDWSEEMSNCLFAKNKFGFVDGSIYMPQEGSSDLLQWKRCDLHHCSLGLARFLSMGRSRWPSWLI